MRYVAAAPPPTPTATVDPTASPTASPSPTPTPVPTPPPIPAGGPGLAVGVTEFNANLVASPAQRQIPAPWAAARDALGAIKPAYFRLVIDWASMQPSADARGGPERAARGLHARDRPVPGLGRRARSAQGARLAPARGRVAGARRARDDARLGRGRAVGL